MFEEEKESMIAVLELKPGMSADFGEGFTFNLKRWVHS